MTAQQPPAPSPHPSPTQTRRVIAPVLDGAGALPDELPIDFAPPPLPLPVLDAAEPLFADPEPDAPAEDDPPDDDPPTGVAPVQRGDGRPFRKRAGRLVSSAVGEVRKRAVRGELHERGGGYEDSQTITFSSAFFASSPFPPAKMLRLR
ncbi:hypothetical protein B0H14DRAFT_2580148 [Mycena olivaceomarginata]|nr:hypothetical protein B0H14DRAFT_2580148 [Mycena olivaceomarginata]